MPRRVQVERQEDADELKQLYQAEKDHQNRARLQALWHLCQGRTVSEVADLVGKDPRTIQDWVTWYRMGSVAEVRRHRHGGHSSARPRLTCMQQGELKALSEQGEVQTVWVGVHWAEKQGVTYTYWGMRHVYERLKLKGASTAPLVQRWGEDGASVIVWDRARGHRGPAYEYVAVQLIEQPPYSPELNPAERVFEYLRGKVEGLVHGTIDAKKGATEAELEKLAAGPDKVKSLAGWGWICQSVNDLSSSNTVFQ